MSEFLAAAAASLGAPEHLVERAAHARAEADGTTYEAVLSAWAGGAPAPASAPAAPTAPSEPIPAAPTTAPTTADQAAPASPAPAAAVATLVPQPATPAVTVSPARSKATPILEGRRFHPVRTWLMMAGLFLLGLLITLIGPFNTGGDYRHLVPDARLSELGERGRDVYLNHGCGYCHTQLVRPVLADVGLGPATETFADALSASTFGVHRIGPDLAHVGARPSYGGQDEPATVDDFMALMNHPEQVLPGSMHPSYSHLSDRDLTALATYLAESK